MLEKFQRRSKEILPIVPLLGLLLALALPPPSPPPTVEADAYMVLILDTNMALHQMDFIAEDECINHVVVPYTVLQDRTFAACYGTTGPQKTCRMLF